MSRREHDHECIDWRCAYCCGREEAKGVAKGVAAERARIVAWLRGQIPAVPYYQWTEASFRIEHIAERIERGEHEEKT